MKTCSEKALEWNVTPRTVNAMCKNGRIQGAVKEKRTWLIPDDAEKPLDGRISTGKYSRKKTGKEKKTLPVGISDYVRAQSEYYYVDKTLLIKEFLDRKPLVSLFTRPRRFGKTLNMDMLRVFFEISEDDTSKYFTDKAIWKCGEKYRRHQGKYPVIFLTFKDVKFDTWEATIGKIRGLLQEEYGRHQELLSSDRISQYEREYFEKILGALANDVELTSALERLSKMLTPGRTHPTPAGRNEGANRASVIGRSRQVGCDTPVGSRLPIAVLRPQSPLSAPDAEANHTGNIGSKTVRRRLGALPVKIPVASLQTGIRKFCCTNMFSGCGTCRTEPYIRIRYSSETGGETPDHSSDEYPAEEHLYLCFPCDGGVPGLCPGRGCLWGFGAFL